MKTNRRDFLWSAASVFATGCSSLFDVGQSGAYSVTLVGDTHFDSTDPLFYHRNYLTDTSKGRYDAHKKEHVRNAEMWLKRMPDLLRAAGRCRRSDAAFALQMGDLVQGDCGNGDTHRQMLADAVGAFKKEIPIPFVTVCGNHDIRGTDAQIAYNRYITDLLTHELRTPVDRTTFAFRQGPDVFIVADFNVKETVEPGEDYGRIVKLLDESRGARHAFLVTHGPFICKSRWSLLGSRKRDAQRMELTRILAARNAIVLAGHTHKTEYDDCHFPEGRIQQIVLNSVWTPGCPKTLKMAHTKPEQFLDKKASADQIAFTADRRRALRQHWQSAAACHAQLEVSDKSVSVAFFPCDAVVPAYRQTL